ncbi:MAG: hypothetical protein AAF633_11690 [Chloroflexota bacterium]
MIGITLFIIYFIIGCASGNEAVSRPQADAAFLHIQLNTENGSQHFDVAGLPTAVIEMLQETALSEAEWAEIYPVAVEGISQPMFGSYTVDITSNTLRFTPAFPLMAGQAYVASFSQDALVDLRPESASYLSEPIEISEQFTLAKEEIAPTNVTAVYPTADRLPSNMLRFYVYFSAPMRDGDALDHVTLLDASGNEVSEVFFDPIFELWDPSRQRLTLLFDPGRVKTGLRAHEALGRALVPGQRYTLRIEASLLDANDTPLEAAFEKSFTAAEPDLTPPSVEAWQIDQPNANNRDPLVVQFPAPLDHQLLEEYIQIRTADGERVQGEIRVNQQEREWHFVPNRPWQTGDYELWVNTKLEDIAGNNLHGLFDTPPEERTLLLDQTEVIVPFLID